MSAHSWTGRIAPQQRRRSLATDPDSYYGPGGLSARQIMDELQKNRAKEAEAARKSPPRATASEAPGAARVSEAELSKLSSRELREKLVARHVDISDCFERADLLQRARAHLC